MSGGATIRRSSQTFAVVPAAGESRRMGEPKLLLRWRGGTVFESVLQAWLASRIDRVLVVVRGDERRLTALCRDPRVQVVRADLPPVDMKASVGWALRAIQRQADPQPHDAWLLAPADLPLLETGAIEALIAAWQADPREAILVPVHHGRRGHPVLFPWSLAAAVDSLGANEGVNALLTRHPVREIPCAATPGSDHDLDTPDDYQRLRAQHES